MWTYLGPNGAGKSSIYHSIIGLVKPTFGKIIINGIDATDIPTHLDVLNLEFHGFHNMVVPGQI